MLDSTCWIVQYGLMSQAFVVVTLFSGVAKQLLNRLKLTDQKLDALVDGIRSIANQDEPLNKILARTELSEGLVLEKTTCPIGESATPPPAFL
jgi:delta-1-pyrroline-5-carboxylate synthetase